MEPGHLLGPQIVRNCAVLLHLVNNLFAAARLTLAVVGSWHGRIQAQYFLVDQSDYRILHSLIEHLSANTDMKPWPWAVVTRRQIRR